MTDIGKLVLDLEEQIELAYRKHEWGTFVPEQFVAADLGTYEEIVMALQRLVLGGKLHVRVVFYDVDGNSIWGGPADSPEVRGEVSLDTDTDPEGAELIFDLTSEWRERLSEKRTVLASSLTALELGLGDIE